MGIGSRPVKITLTNNKPRPDNLTLSFTDPGETSRRHGGSWLIILQLEPSSSDPLGLTPAAQHPDLVHHGKLASKHRYPRTKRVIWRVIFEHRWWQCGSCAERRQCREWTSKRGCKLCIWTLALGIPGFHFVEVGSGLCVLGSGLCSSSEPEPREKWVGEGGGCGLNKLCRANLVWLWWWSYECPVLCNLELEFVMFEKLEIIEDFSYYCSYMVFKRFLTTKGFLKKK